MSSGVVLQKDSVRKKVLAYTTEASTWYLLKVSLTGTEFSLNHAKTGDEVTNEAKKRTYDIYIIEASSGDGDIGFSYLKKIVQTEDKGKVRVLMLIGEVPPIEANHIEAFGPLGFLECYFTKKRLNDTLKQLMEMKDTGCRVKGDSKFFDITMFDKK